MAVSYKLIAEKAGVSRQAAASVLNGAVKCLVSKEKKELILKLAKELNYVRNNAARTLVRGKSGLVGILSGGFHVKRTGLFIISVDNVLRANGFLPVSIYTRSEYSSIADGIRSLLAQNVDALIINGIYPDEKGSIITSLKAQGLLDMVPTLVTNSGFHSGLDAVYFSYDNVIELICSKAERGDFNRVRSFVRGTGKPGVTYEAGVAIRKIVEKLNIHDFREIEIFSSLPFASEQRKNDIFSEVHRAMEDIVPGTLYLCDTGFCAIQVASLLQQKYGRFPEEFAVAAFDHTENCGFFSPRISSVELNFDLFAQKCFELLKRRMADSGVPALSVDIPTDFVERETF